MADKILIEELKKSEKATALTNKAASEIERLESELQIAVNERNEAWCIFA